MTAQPFPFETMPMAAARAAEDEGSGDARAREGPPNRQQSVREFYDELTIGTTRLSFIGGGVSQSASFPPAQTGGHKTGPVGGGYPSGQMPGRGQTQVGEPLFAPGGVGAPSATMVDAPAMQPVQASSGVPTGGGHAFPAPPATGPKKSNAGPIIGVAAVLVAAAAVGGVLLLRGGKNDVDPPPITVDAGPAASFTAEPVTSTGSATDAGVATADTGKIKPSTGSAGATSGGATSGGATSGGATSGGATDPKADQACDATTAAALGNNVGIAAGQFRNCSGPKRAKALAALDAASVRKAKDGCRAKGELRQAAAVGASSGLNALPANCK